MQERKNFIPRNEGFVCLSCGKQVPPAPGTFRNHCPFCLTAKHVDETIPGDRASACGGLMPTIRIEGTNPDKLDLVQQCMKCNKVGVNRTSPDDNKDKIIAIMQARI